LLKCKYYDKTTQDKTTKIRFQCILYTILINTYYLKSLKKCLKNIR